MQLCMIGTRHRVCPCDRCAGSFLQNCHTFNTSSGLRCCKNGWKLWCWRRWKMKTFYSFRLMISTASAAQARVRVGSWVYARPLPAAYTLNDSWDLLKIRWTFVGGGVKGCDYQTNWWELLRHAAWIIYYIYEIKRSINHPCGAF